MRSREEEELQAVTQMSYSAVCSELQKAGASEIGQVVWGVKAWGWDMGLGQG